MKIFPSLTIMKKNTHSSSAQLVPPLLPTIERPKDLRRRFSISRINQVSLPIPSSLKKSKELGSPTITGTQCRRSKSYVNGINEDGKSSDTIVYMNYNDDMRHFNPPIITSVVCPTGLEQCNESVEAQDELDDCRNRRKTPGTCSILVRPVILILCVTLATISYNFYKLQEEVRILRDAEKANSFRFANDIKLLMGEVEDLDYENMNLRGHGASGLR